MLLDGGSGFLGRDQLDVGGDVERLDGGEGEAVVLAPGEEIADEESIAAIIRITRGNFRLLHRLLTQIGRVLEINTLENVTGFVAESSGRPPIT